MAELQDKVAIVTGAASGIGQATARRFAEEGARVVLADIEDEMGRQLAHDLGAGASYVHADVASEAEVEAMVAHAVATFGGLDVIYNNAGFSGVTGGIEEIPADGWAHTMDVLLKGVYFGMKHAARAMKTRGGGAIVSTASIAGITTGISAPHVYNVAKAGVIHMTKSVAVELGPHGIRVNCVCPGFIATPIFARSLGMPSQMAQGTVETIRPLFDDLQPIRRAGRPEDIAEAVLWLASERASFVTGHALVVDGGATAGTKWEPSSERARMLKEAMGAED